MHSPLKRPPLPEKHRASRLRRLRTEVQAFLRGARPRACHLVGALLSAAVALALAAALVDLLRTGDHATLSRLVAGLEFLHLVVLGFPPAAKAAAFGAALAAVAWRALARPR